MSGVVLLGIFFAIHCCGAKIQVSPSFQSKCHPYFTPNTDTVYVLYIIKTSYYAISRYRRFVLSLFFRGLPEPFG